jgi:hypothetical protein
MELTCLGDRHTWSPDLTKYLDRRKRLLSMSHGLRGLLPRYAKIMLIFLFQVMQKKSYRTGSPVTKKVYCKYSYFWLIDCRTYSPDSRWTAYLNFLQII